jgi:peroxiredoxin
MKISLTITLSILTLHTQAQMRGLSTPASPIGKTINSFSLRNTDAQTFSLDTNQKGYIIVFTCNHCPFAKLYTQRFNELNKKYKTLGIPLIAINSMDSVAYEEESFELMQEKAKEDSLSFPYLQDGTQSIAKKFGADRTPHAYIIWKVDSLIDSSSTRPTSNFQLPTKWTVKYSGAIDDNGEHPELATPFIANALNELLNNKPVKQAETESMGCAIFYKN